MGLEEETILNVTCDHEGCTDFMSEILGTYEEPDIRNGWGVRTVVVEVGEAIKRTRYHEKYLCPEHLPLYEEEA